MFNYRCFYREWPYENRKSDRPPVYEWLQRRPHQTKIPLRGEGEMNKNWQKYGWNNGVDPDEHDFWFGLGLLCVFGLLFLAWAISNL